MFAPYDSFLFLTVRIIFYSLTLFWKLILQHRIERNQSLKYLANILYIVFWSALGCVSIHRYVRRFNAVQFENVLAWWPLPLCTTYFVLRFHETLRVISIGTFARMPASWLRNAVLQSIFLSEPLRRSIELRECTFLVRSKGLTRRQNEIYWNFRIETNSSKEVHESYNTDEIATAEK